MQAEKEARQYEQQLLQGEEDANQAALQAEAGAMEEQRQRWTKDEFTFSRIIIDFVLIKFYYLKLSKFSLINVHVLKFV